VLAEIKQLLELQRIDDEIADLGAHLASLTAQRARLEERIDAERASVESLQGRLAGLERESRLKNLEVDELDESIREYQHRLDKGIISFKEMEDLRAKIESERVRISRMEDEALELMDLIERTREELVEAERALEEREAQLRAEIERIASGLEETDGKIAGLKAERERLAGGITPYILSQYETLHKKYRDPLAAIVQGTCSGCKLRLSGNTIERAKGGMGVVQCEHCSRILYVD